MSQATKFIDRLFCPPPEGPELYELGPKHNLNMLIRIPLILLFTILDYGHLKNPYTNIILYLLLIYTQKFSKISGEIFVTENE